MVDILVGFFFLRIVQRRQAAVAVLPLQCVGKQIVADMGILGKERTVEISSHYIFVQNSFSFVFTVISVSIENLSKRPVFSNIGPSSVVFKTYDGEGKVFISRTMLSISLGLPCSVYKSTRESPSIVPSSVL